MLKQTTEQTESAKASKARQMMRGEEPASFVGTAGNEGRPLHVCVTTDAEGEDRHEARMSEDVAGKAKASMAKKNGRYKEARQCPNPFQGSSKFKVGEQREGGTGGRIYRIPNTERKEPDPRSPAGKGRPGEDTQPCLIGNEDEDEDDDENEDVLTKGGVMKMKSKMMMTGLVAGVIGLGTAGCTSLSQAVPKTKIKGDLKSGRFSVEAPKNASINGFELNYSTNETRIKFTEYKAEMDPNVVEQSGKAQAAIITATSQAIQAATEKAIEGMKK